MTTSPKEKEKKKLNPQKIISIVSIAVMLIILFLDYTGLFASKIKYICFVIYVIICIGMAVASRRSIGKMILTVLFFLYGLYEFLKSIHHL